MLAHIECKHKIDFKNKYHYTTATMKKLRESVGIDQWKEPCESAKEPYISAKVPCTSAKEPCISACPLV